MLKKVLLITITALSLISCSNSSSKFTDDDAYDTENPTTFEAYKEWRKKNDPAAEKYAEYKRWEISYRRWKREQEEQQ